MVTSYLTTQPCYYGNCVLPHSLTTLLHCPLFTSTKITLLLLKPIIRTSLHLPLVALMQNEDVVKTFLRFSYENGKLSLWLLHKRSYAKNILIHVTN